MWMVDFSPAVYDKYRLRGSVRIHDRYVREYTIRTDFYVQITPYNTQYVYISCANYTIGYIVRTDFPVQITRYDTLYVRIYPYKLHDMYGNTYAFSMLVRERF